MELITCSRCKREQLHTEFFARSKKTNGLRSECKSCSREDHRKWKDANRDSVNAKARAWRSSDDSAPTSYRERCRDNDLVTRYGITSADYDDLLRFQGGGCAICGAGPGARKLSVDHDHATGEVRGVLCERCNRRLLGSADDDVRVLQRAIDYLTNPPTAQFRDDPMIRARQMAASNPGKQESR